MEFEITVTSHELVKPSFLHLNHLPHHQLSFLDQLAPPIFMPFVFFYHNEATTLSSDRERSDHIKRSLSEILNIFYPLAGRIKNSGDVVCNNVGVSFMEAKADCNISQILENHNPNQLNKFLPFESHEASDVPLTVQLTFFKCGGTALGVGLSHKLCDALSSLIFIKSWAAFARGDMDEIVTPSFDLAKMFPPCDIEDLNMATGITKDNVVTRRFVFSKSSIESLRERFSGNKEIRATRVEALSVFIWSRFMASTTKPDDKNRKIYTLIHPVNLRRQADPFIPDNMFGNIMRFSVTVPQGMVNEDDEAKRYVVEQMREEIRKIDAVYVKKLQDDSRGHLEFLNKQASGFVKGEIVSFSFTSLCKFPVYEADFGWGKPLWVASARMSYKNLVAFIDTKEGDGIEAWINLDQNDMSRFETDEELIRYVSSSASVNVFASS